MARTFHHGKRLSLLADGLPYAIWVHRMGSLLFTRWANKRLRLRQKAELRQGEVSTVSRYAFGHKWDAF